MGFRAGYKKFGPFRVNLSTNELQKGRAPISSVALDLGALNFRLWSRNGSRGLSSIDTPGLGAYRPNLSTRSQRENGQAAPFTTNPASHDPAPFTLNPNG